jgi:hypothetical protein
MWTPYLTSNHISIIRVGEYSGRELRGCTAGNPGVVHTLAVAREPSRPEEEKA